ncbi:RNA-binding protein [Roseiconus nitratireducens]|uniref:RNA-binding protein n=1 Tax=Roseiconus nitratireducens TaxID=2605748 RepID=A0A5M6DME6_9BACT|nr:FG-GAP-like repeat-containing protein [Roseiconus nitratireducens]KAA5547310.1 RNA-binding protein [Roseiconus nitratireducens]
MRDTPRCLRWVLPIALFLGFCGCRPAGGPTTDNPSNSSQGVGLSESGFAEHSSENNFILAQQAFGEGDFDSARAAAQKALLESPGDVDTLKLLAQIHAATGDDATAANMHRQLASREIPERLNLLLQAFEWNVRAGRFDVGETDMIRAIEWGIDDSRAAQVLCQLYNSQGRRYEACQQALQLARMRPLQPEELHSLLERSGPFQLVSFSEFLPSEGITLFDLGQARVLDAVKQDHDAALAKVQAVSRSVPAHPAVEAYRGKLLALRTGNSEALHEWHRSLPGGIEEHPEYWVAIGIWQRDAGEDRSAVRSFAEAIRRDPTDRVAMREIESALIRLGEDSKAESIHQTIAVLDELYRRSDRATLTVQNAKWIASRMQEMIRPWESLGWSLYALGLQGNALAAKDVFAQRREKIAQWEESSGEAKIRDARLKKLLGFSLDEFPIIAPASADRLQDCMVERGGELPDARGANALTFENVANQLGIETQFISDYPLESSKFYLYQANGGGLAALDYDLDGLCDLYVVQSGGNPEVSQGSTPNELYRQIISGEQFQTVSDASCSSDRGFGQGVCVCDLNQDGFPDLLVGNIGRNCLLLNQGDGTFVDASESLPDDRMWTSSIAAADLNGDHLPEIVAANYVDDPQVFRIPCVGSRTDCHPHHFSPAVDQAFLNRGDGTFEIDRDSPVIPELPNYSLGAVIANFDGVHGNDVFVSADGKVNHYFTSQSRAETGGYRLVENAVLAGCSVGINGRQQACMGIAIGDVDTNGTLDLAITNFHNEAINLFLQSRQSIFLDSARRYRLAKPTEPTLGFGIQAADFDNDGWLDLALLNGHIYDNRDSGEPYRMRPQLFRRDQKGFVAQAPESAGGYWEKKSLGRTLAQLDFNRDGRMDLVGNHLDRPIAVLKNDSQSGNWLQLRLVGVESERDAVGAIVRAQFGGRVRTVWQSSGGYMVGNESILHIGLDQAKAVDELTVRWPSGKTQTFSGLPVNARLLIIENQHQVTLESG